ncbi:hypothetical protein D2Q93_02140 [Alicyclobacillaceae bacterium I2511]|nr:hypothetical protein D2Q93_02140 [Alicyclobacillaceae bacterium I2511]
MSVIPSSGISFGFTPGDLLTNSSALVTSVAGFVLLALAFPVAMWFVHFIKGVLASRRGRQG